MTFSIDLRYAPESDLSSTMLRFLENVEMLWSFFDKKLAPRIGIAGLMSASSGNGILFDVTDSPGDTSLVFNTRPFLSFGFGFSSSYTLGVFGAILRGSSGGFSAFVSLVLSAFVSLGILTFVSLGLFAFVSLILWVRIGAMGGASVKPALLWTVGYSVVSVVGESGDWLPLYDVELTERGPNELRPVQTKVRQRAEFWQSIGLL